MYQIIQKVICTLTQNKKILVTALDDIHLISLEKTANMKTSQNVPLILTTWQQKYWCQWTPHSMIMSLCCWWIQRQNQDYLLVSLLEDVIIPSAALIGKNNTGMISTETHYNILNKGKKQKQSWQNEISRFKRFLEVFRGWWQEFVHPLSADSHQTFPSTTQHVGWLVFTHQNVFSVSAWDSSPTCTVKMSQRRGNKNKFQLPLTSLTE